MDIEFLFYCGGGEMEFYLEVDLVKVIYLLVLVLVFKYNDV